MSGKNATQMKLGNFISQVLTEIIDGVATAQEYATGKGASINPPHVIWNENKKGYNIPPGVSGKDETPLLTTIEFEILVTIGEDDSAQGGLGIFAASLGLGVRGEVKEYSETVNKIKFELLTKLPQQEKKR